MDFTEFRKQWVKEHPASIPPRPRFDYGHWWLIVLIFVMMISAAIVSMVHTIPAIYDTVDQDTLKKAAPIFADLIGLVAVAAFAFIELTLFGVEYLSTVERFVADPNLRLNLGGLAKTMSILSLSVAILGNLQSSLGATTNNTSTPLASLVAICVSLAGPLNAMLAGRMLAFVVLITARNRRAVVETYRNAMHDLDAKINAAWTKHQRNAAVPHDVPAEQEAAQNGTDFVPPEHDLVPEWNARNIAEHLAEHPDMRQWTVRDLAEHFGVGNGTIQRAKTILKRSR